MNDFECGYSFSVLDLHVFLHHLLDDLHLSVLFELLDDRLQVFTFSPPRSLDFLLRHYDHVHVDLRGGGLSVLLSRQLGIGWGKYIA
jgi:hypothetical protein